MIRTLIHRAKTVSSWNKVLKGEWQRLLKIVTIHPSFCRECVIISYFKGVSEGASSVRPEKMESLSCQVV